MIRACTVADEDAILEIVNDAAEAYRGVIPEDRFTEPYMSRDELRAELRAGVEFVGWEEDRRLLGVMGAQDVDDVTLIRHAYVRSGSQGRGIGGALLDHLVERASGPLLVGTWAAAEWAIRFYRARGFRAVEGEEGERLLRRYWTIPERQVETSVVLAGPGWAPETR